MRGHWAPFFCPLSFVLLPFPSPLLDDRNWSSPGVRRGVHVILCVYCFLMLSFINYLSIIYLFSVDTIFDWLTPLFCHVLVRGGDPILTLIMYICFVHVSF